MSDLPRKAAARTAKLAALPLGFAGRTAVGWTKRLGGASAEAVMLDVQARTAEQIFRTLGELKGGAMKVGQAMSIFEGALPEELAGPYREQLTKLQDSAPPMPTMTVRKILTEQLGPNWRESLVEFDADPAAAASIGQVHRGRWCDGREVAIKVQYPGADEALASDLKQISRLAGSIGPVLPGIDLKALVSEVRERAIEELDYELEASAQRALAEAYRDDPDIVIPDVVAATERVLVTEWLESDGSLSKAIKEGSEAERNHYGLLLVTFFLDSPGRTGLLHSDPHPGNFRLIPGAAGEPGKLGVLDFGAVARLPGQQLPRSLGELIRVAGSDDSDALLDQLRKNGFVKEKVKIDAEAVRNYLGIILEPTLVEEFHFSRTWMQRHFELINSSESDAMSVAMRLNLPPEYLLIHRTWSGCLAVLSQLDATVPFRQLVSEYIPGFAS